MLYMLGVSRQWDGMASSQRSVEKWPMAQGTMREARTVWYALSSERLLLPATIYNIHDLSDLYAML